MYDGTECKAIAPRCGQVSNFDSSIAISHLLTPLQ